MVLFEQNFKESFQRSIQSARENRAAAIYIEYDLDNNWECLFFICNEYTELSEQNDDWASEWIAKFEGPSLEDFSNIYRKYGFDCDEKAIGTTLFLIVRMVAICKKICFETINTNLPICIAYHDQDPIMRIQG